MEQVVESEGEDGEWSVGFVTGLTAHGLPPKVVHEEPAYWGTGKEVKVLLNSEYVIMD